MPAQWKKAAATLSAAALLCLGAQAALANDHEHSHEAAGPVRLTLDHGHKWATDDSLRQGMTRIRDALTAALPAIHAGKATAEQYRALAQKVDDQLAFLFQNCKLKREADAMLHIILADIIAGADAMKGADGSKARAGVEKIARALDNYGTYFDHPGWNGVKPAQ
jgi:hypothetical protein